MKFSVTGAITKIAAVCSPDKSKPSITQPWFDADLQEIQASDQYVAVRVPVEAEKTDTTGPVPLELVKAAVKAKAAALKLPKRGKKDPVVNYPNLAAIWPQGKPLHEIGISVDLLKAAADAVGAKNGAVKLGFYGPLKPMTVKPLLAESQGDFYGADLTPREDTPANAVALPEGIVMPLRVAGMEPDKAAAKTVKTVKDTGKAAKPKKGGDSGTEDTSGLSPAQKAWITRRGKVAAKPEKPAEAKGNGNGASGGKKVDLVDALRQSVKASKPKTAKAAPKDPKGKEPYAGTAYADLTAGQKAALTKYRQKATA